MDQPLPGVGKSSTEWLAEIRAGLARARPSTKRAAECRECGGSPDRFVWWQPEGEGWNCRPCSVCYPLGYRRWAKSRIDSGGAA